MRLGQHQEKFSRDLASLLSYAFSKGYEARIGEVQRPLEMQKMHIAAGRSTTMNSMHLKKCAADIYFTKEDHLVFPQDLGDYWESLDHLNKWGGNWKNFKDKPHYQRTC